MDRLAKNLQDVEVTIRLVNTKTGNVLYVKSHKTGDSLLDSIEELRHILLQADAAVLQEMQKDR